MLRSSLDDILTALTLALLLPLLAVLLLVLLQRHILFPRSKTNLFLESAHHSIVETRIPVDGAELHAYHAIPRQSLGPGRALLYFNGRRENPTSVFRCLDAVPDHHVVCFHYRKLGPALAKPGERRLVEDGLGVLDWLAAEHGIPFSGVTVGGRSLGSGIAVQVAGARPVRQLVLISPFDCLHHVVRNRFPFVLACLMKDSFRSNAFIQRVRCRCLVIFGEQDRTVPPALTRRLFNGWTGELTEISIGGHGHRGLLRLPEVHRSVGEFCA